MKQQIEQLKKEIQAFLELEKLATKGRWNVTGIDTGSRKQESYVKIRGTRMGAKFKIADCPFIDVNGSMEEKEGTGNATFIAASRNISPAMAKMLLVAVDGLENVTTWNLEVGDRCRNRLREILSIWEGAKRQCA